MLMQVERYAVATSGVIQAQACFLACPMLLDCFVMSLDSVKL
jgi:hypothetical protein